MTTPYTACCGQLAKTPKKWLITGVAGFIGSNLSSYAPTHRLAERVQKRGQTPLPNIENSRYIIKNKCSNY
jgi:dTDP-D-glucose 4,6-dehydratase